MPSVYFSEDDMCTTQKLALARVQDWFVANGWSVETQDPRRSDLVFCVTCNGWSLLQARSFERLAKLKTSVDQDKLVMYGCVADAHPDKVAAVHHGRTIRTRTMEHEIESLVPSAKVPLANIPHRSTFRTREDYRNYDLTKRFVNIAAGCTFNCSFCTHKPGLGERRSRTLEDVLDQVRKLMQEDVKVIVLTGMETAYWGVEFGLGYPDLLRSVMEVADTFEIHVAQFNPQGIHRYYDGLLPLFQNKRVADIQIPIQTTSERILKMMRRPNHTDKVGRFIREVRRVNSRAVLRTDLIVGWPTESMAELDASLDFAAAHFDEVATYAIQITEELPAWDLRDRCYSKEELDRRVEYSKSYLASRNLTAHAGQQDDATMQGIEQMRARKHAERMKQAGGV